MSPHDNGLIFTAQRVLGSEEIFHLTGSLENPLLHPAIRTKDMTAITWVELTKLVLADGTTWESSTPGECVIQPSLYVPVNTANRSQ
jgi:hypothetical protein